MFRLNFATRLMLAMMFIVTMVSVCIFAVTRQSLESAWREIFDARFRSQTASLESMQKARLDNIQERCRQLAASDTVIKAVQSDSASLPDEIRKELMELARVVEFSAASYKEPDNRPSGGLPTGKPGPGADNPAPNGNRSSWWNNGGGRNRQNGPPMRPDDASVPGPEGSRAPGPKSAGPVTIGPEGTGRSPAGSPRIPDFDRPWEFPPYQNRLPRGPNEGAAAEPPPGQQGGFRSRFSRPAEEKSGLTAPVTAAEAGFSPDRPGPPGGGPDRQRRGFPWVRPDSIDLALMDATGRILSLKSGPDAQTDWLEKNNVRSVPATQEVAYMSVKPEGGRGRFRMPPRFSEVILTPIVQKDTGAVLGALVVGLPVSTYGESALYDLNRRGKTGDLFTGQWIDDQLFSNSIPREAVEETSKVIRESLKNSDTPADSLITYKGTPYQLLFRSLNPSASTPQAWQITLFSLAGLAEEKAEVRSKVIAYSAVAFAAAILLSWLLSRRLVHPVRALVAGTHRIKKGEYNIPVPITTHDELATLAISFNEMAEGLKQRERYRDILFQVSDDDIARQLIETASLGGERREISVLFCDIRSFTATTSGMAPESIIDMLNEHMTALTEIVHRHHGVVDKFVGDLIMAIFGAPKMYGDDAGNAAACALEMVARREELNQTTEHPPLLMGIGIASGTAVAGCMGSENRLNYTVLGEPVNLASRLCSAAGPREVIIDPQTAALLGARAYGHTLRPLSLKGFPEPVQPFHLTRLLEKPKPASLAEPAPAAES